MLTDNVIFTVILTWSFRISSHSINNDADNTISLLSEYLYNLANTYLLLTGIYKLFRRHKVWFE